MKSDSFLVDNADLLFKILQRRYSKLKVGEDSSQVRNIVRKGFLDGTSCYIKIGKKEHLENAIRFMEECP